MQKALPRSRRAVTAISLLTATFVATSAPIDSPAVVSADSGVKLEFVGRADSGMGLGGSEISSYDPATKHLFVTNGATNKIDIFDIKNPAAPRKLTSINLSGLGATGVQSVATKNGLVAIAASMNGDNQAPGRIFVTNADGVIDPRAPQGVSVGSLPDSVHFSPDGRWILSANEGEPKNYCLVDGALPLASDPHGSVSIIDTTKKTLTAGTVDFAAFNTSKDDILAAGGRVYGPNASVAQDIEPEFIAISPDSKTAFVTLQENNSVAVIDIASGQVSRFLGLGYKDHSAAGRGIDASDRDSAINIAQWNVKGMYEPDGIATFVGRDGETYFATANEGDAREYPCLLGGAPAAGAQAEDVRVGSVGVDGTSLTSDLAADAKLGRLSVTRFHPATYTNNGTATTATASTDFTSVYSLGARSMTIWKMPTSATTVGSATLVADTGDLFEQKVASLYAANFNSDWDSSKGTVNAKDTRSDNKGPEPEGIAVGRAYGRTLAFVGLERAGGVMTLDISDPKTPAYLDYANTSVFTANGGANFYTGGNPAGDVSPEGILFISATDSPIGVPLVLAAHELSGTTAIYKVIGTATKPTSVTGISATMTGTRATVRWNAPADDGGARISRYTVTASPGGAKCIARSTRTCILSGLRKGVSYVFSVKARNSVGETVAKSAVFTADLDARVASVVTTAVSGLDVTVRAVAPLAGTAPVKYVFELRKDGELVARRVVRNTKTDARGTVSAKSAGTHTVTVVALFSDGSKKVWNGPNITVAG